MWEGKYIKRKMGRYVNTMFILLNSQTKVNCKTMYYNSDLMHKIYAH